MCRSPVIHRGLAVSSSNIVHRLTGPLGSKWSATAIEWHNQCVCIPSSTVWGLLSPRVCVSRSDASVASRK